MIGSKVHSQAQGAERRWVNQETARETEGISNHINLTLQDPLKRSKGKVKQSQEKLIEVKNKGRYIGYI